MKKPWNAEELEVIGQAAKQVEATHFSPLELLHMRVTPHDGIANIPNYRVSLGYANNTDFKTLDHDYMVMENMFMQLGLKVEAGAEGIKKLSQPDGHKKVQLQVSSPDLGTFELKHKLSALRKVFQREIGAAMVSDRS